MKKDIFLRLLSDVSQYIAIFPYEAQQDDELSFPADAILEILDQTSANGWFKAQLGDRVGLIPSTYVQAIDNHQSCKSSLPLTHLNCSILYDQYDCSH